MRSLLGTAVLAFALVSTGAFLYANESPAAATQPHHDLSATIADNSNVAKQYAFRATMRELWEDHIVWTRQVIVAIVAGTPDTDAALTRLLRNQSDIGDAIRPFYGDAAGDQLTALLRDHILIAGGLLTAAKTGDTTGFDAAKADWYANGDAIAQFLASANPHWPIRDLQSTMKTHLDTTLDEAVARLTGDWNADVVAYDIVHKHILHMADTLSEGIIAQFPSGFANSK